MDLTVLNERDFYSYLQEENKKTFLKMIETFENYIAPIMRSKGYKRINQAERTVLFSFGEITFSRSRWKKDGETKIPVDEKLGLVSHTRFSKEVLYQLTKLANYMPYRKVAEVMELLNQVYVTKDSVLSAIQKAGELLKEKEDYRILSPEVKQEKIKPEVLYIEGDGVWVKSSQEQEGSCSKELSHFVVHTGCQENNRRTLKDKLEVISINYKEAKDKILDLIHNHFDITSETVIVTNSDGGGGYTPKAFKELAAAFSPKKHIHFWDAFHVNQLIKRIFNPFPPELKSLTFEGVKKQDKETVSLALDTAEALIDNEEKLEPFQRLKRQLLRNFDYTHRPEHQGLSSKGIGVMESQHRKITYRMKNKGMYWSYKGADTISQTILLDHEGKLRDLFFGDWRENYEIIQERSQHTTGYFLRVGTSKKIYDLPKVDLPQKTVQIEE